MRRRRSILPLVLCPALALVFAAGWVSCGKSTANKNTSQQTRAAEPIVADGWVIQPATYAENVAAVGTLIPNETVNVVPETSGRLQHIDFVEGATVKAGDLIARLDDSQLQAQLGEFKSRRFLADSNFRRQQNLLRGQSASRQEFDQAQNELAVIDAQIKTLEVQIEKTNIRAPFAGVLGLRYASLGAWVTPQTILTTLQDLEKVKVDFTLPERYAADIKIGQPFTFSIAGRGEKFSGIIRAIEPQIDSSSRTLKVRGEADNRQHRLFPGSFAAVEVPLRGRNDAILIPAEAIIPSLRGHSVFVLSEGKAQPREIKIGARTPDKAQVLDGLKPGETLLVSNLLRLRPGVAVRLTQAAAQESSSAPATDGTIR